MKKINKKYYSIIIVSLILLNSFYIINTTAEIDDTNKNEFSDLKKIDLFFNFSIPTVEEYNNYSIVRVTETNLNRIQEGKPVIPVNLTQIDLMFGTKIKNVSYEHSSPKKIQITKKLAYGLAPSFDHMFNYNMQTNVDQSIYNSDESYPADWVSYHTGGGLSEGNRKTFFVLRVHPVLYYPSPEELQYIKHIKVTISYQEPVEPIIDEEIDYDLLVITPNKFKHALRVFQLNKIKHGIKTKIVGLNQVYLKTIGEGRDKQEKIKFFIKDSIEQWGIKNVLLVGGLNGQSFRWNLPVRYSHVVPYEEQEYAEQSFISDIYYADIFDSRGNFSSWDTNENNIFSEWRNEGKDKMDLYPDVYLGRIPCRNIFELRVMINKINRYENKRGNKEWFNNLITVAGDSYNDTNHFNEGELISEKAIEIMPDFTPVNVWASEMDINRKTVNEAMNQGAGFAYFCGHGSPMSWSTHFPPDGVNWTTGYDLPDMIGLRNGYKLPIAIVGGCHNGQFDTTMRRIAKGILEDGLQYFSTKKGNIGEFWYNEWVPNCWAWYLTSKIGGGAIATIANTGLGTHGDGDADNNSVADYLEVLDGWLELKVLEQYAQMDMDILGMNHGDALTGYLHRFIGNMEKMDTKMVQQWELFGDPTLKIGGYN